MPVLERGEPIGDQLDEAELASPALDEAKLRPFGDGLLQLGAVAPDREARVVRCEHEPDELVGPVRERSLDRLGDPRPPVAHARVDRQAELGLERGAGRLGDLVEGVRLLDPEPSVALDEALEQLWLDRSPAADVGVVGRDVLEPVGRAVRHQDDGGGHTWTRAVCSWTSARRRPSTSGSVSGMTP